MVDERRLTSELQSTVTDDSGNIRIRLGKISTGVYGIRIYDANGNLVQEITDSAVNVVKIIGTGVDIDGTVLFSSLVIPIGRKVVFIIAPAGGDDVVTNAWRTMNSPAAYIGGWMLLGTVLATDFQPLVPSYNPVWGFPAYSECKWIWTAGTHTNIKLYARNTWMLLESTEYWEQGQKGMWMALEIDA